MKYTKMFYARGESNHIIPKVLVRVLLTGLLLLACSQSIQAYPHPDRVNTIDFQNMFDQHGLVMMVIDPVTLEIVRANQAAVHFYGYDVSTLESMTIGDINQLTPEEVQQRRDEALGEEQNSFVFPHKLANGEVRTVEVFSWPFLEGDRPLLYSIIIDITPEIAAKEALSTRNRQFMAAVSVVFILLLLINLGLNIIRKKLKTKAREQEQSLDQMQVLIDASQTAVWRYDLKTGEIWYSPEYFQLIGMGKKDFNSLKNKSIEAIWLSHLHPDDREPALSRFMDFVKEPQGMYENFYRLKHTDGHWIWILSRGKWMKDSKGSGFHQLMGINVDINSQKQVEEDLRRAKEKAEAALSVKNDFLANMSHELRTPLNGLCGMLQLLQMTKQTEEQSELSGMALESANALTAVVNDILLFCKLDKQEKASDHRFFHPGHLAEEVVSLYRHKAAEKGLEIQLDMGRHSPEQVKGDALNLRHVLMHTLSNAVKFTQEGKITVSVDVAEGHKQEEALLQMTVHDTGIGMDEETLEKIFEPFYQGDEVHHKRFAGTGLGLAIVENLTVKMGGRIEADSAPGEGSRFIITIPVEKYGR